MGSLAAVIPAFRSERTIRRCVVFAEEAPGAELIVVESAPDDASAAVARSICGVSVLVAGRRLLPHPPRNLGWRSTAVGAAWRHGGKAEVVAAPPLVATSPPTRLTGERVGVAEGPWTAGR